MAGSNAIASGSAILTANADGLKSGLEKSAADVKSWGTRVAGSLSNTFNAKGGTLGALQNIGGSIAGGISGFAAKAKGLLSGAGTGIGMAIGGPIGAAIGGAIGSAVGAVGEAIAGAIAAPFERLDMFGAIKKQADTLGVSASQFQGLTQQFERFGIEGPQATIAMEKFGAKIADAARGAPNASAAFERLGLNAQELAHLPLDQSLLRVSDAIKGLKTPGEQANAAIATFGKAGLALLPMLQKGGSGIQEFIEQQKKTGAVLGDSQIAAAASASKAWKDAKRTISSLWDGLQNRAMLIAAPVIEFASKAVTKIFNFLSPVFEWFGRGVTRVADIASAVFEQLLKWFEIAVNWIKELGAEFGGIGESIPTIQEAITEFFRGFGKAAAYTWDVVKAGAGAFAWMAGKALQFIAPVVDAMKDIIKEIARLGFQVAVRAGNTTLSKFFAGIMFDADKLGAKMDATGKDLEKWGEGTFTNFGQSAEDFSKWLDEALKPKEAAKEVAKTLQDEIGEQLSPVKLAGAVLKGSKEAYSLSVQNQLRGIATQDEPIKGVLKEARKANDINKGVKRNTDKMADVLGNLGEF